MATSPIHPPVHQSLDPTSIYQKVGQQIGMPDEQVAQVIQAYNLEVARQSGATPHELVVDNNAAATETSRLSRQIEDQYDELIQLRDQDAPDQDQKIQACLAHLRDLQSQEADLMEQQFLARLNVNYDEVDALLARAEDLLK